MAVAVPAEVATVIVPFAVNPVTELACRTGVAAPVNELTFGMGCLMVPPVESSPMPPPFTVTPVKQAAEPQVAAVVESPV